MTYSFLIRAVNAALGMYRDHMSAEDYALLVAEEMKAHGVKKPQPYRVRRKRKLLHLPQIPVMHGDPSSN